ncbi:hypothetical protein [Arsenicicoccus dermatophilus]|uniref:hypothetical protein n=1 Tax=Arsenicicoccus dermatophilus TaxID=1076331 RepID=UPI001F4CA433|nr:hypothetical protein [Arsenicicoccus dermatophilus]MCH8612403.1 hypothetical protein [Arsenicicoccus dermatophilus]
MPSSTLVTQERWARATFALGILCVLALAAPLAHVVLVVATLTCAWTWRRAGGTRTGRVWALVGLGLCLLPVLIVTVTSLATAGASS